jgi:hypothetical protein
MTIQEYAENKIKVRVTFASGNKKWGWIHLYDNRYWLTRGNKVGFSLDTATKIEPMKSKGGK